MNILKTFYTYYRIDEVDSTDLEYLPQPPSEKEKYSYIKRYNKTMIIFSIVSFIAIQISMFHFLQHNHLLWPLFAYFIFTLIYFLDSLLVNLFSKDFDINAHKKLVKKWSPFLTDRVDIFLPTAGESLAVLQNTWNGILELKQRYKGKIIVYCLDDANRKDVRVLARQYGFYYQVRPKRGWFKKAGNLRYGFKISNGEFIAIFDADFRPREDFLEETLPYFHEKKEIGLVQSPQYFDVNASQNWLQRGAGAVQELFYRISQVSRQTHDASICVGSNAVYRRSALDDTGGTALIEHSEDVHTGFNMRMHGWKIQYIPVILAKGLCPADMKAFFKQQYRWCLGSMTLLGSAKFWDMRLPFMARMGYFSGFFYYLHTAVSSFFVPIIPLALILLYPDQVTPQNYLFVLPSFLFVQLIYPLWHRATYGLEAWSTRSVYGWAHLFAVFDAITKQKMQWRPTGLKGGKDYRYISFRIFQIIFNLLPTLLWIYFSAEEVIAKQHYVFLPLLLGGIYYYFITAKVSFYRSQPTVSQRSRFKTSLAFALFNLFLLFGMPFLWHVQAAQAISHTKTVTVATVKQIPQTVIAHNKAIISNSLSGHVLATKSASLDEGYYLALAGQQESYADMIGRILNTYSAETGDLLTLQERNAITKYLVAKYSKQQVKVGTEIQISRSEMKLYVQAAKSIFLKKE